MCRKGMFEAVSHMNEAFNNPKGDPANINWERLEKQCKNIEGEFKELMDALAVRDLDGVRDALCDINVFSLGAHHFMGIDANDDMRAVVEGVMTRFCKNDEDYERTALKYADLGVVFYTEGSFPTLCLKSAMDQTDRKGEFYPKGKFLKSASYRETVFTPIGGAKAWERDNHATYLALLLVGGNEIPKETIEDWTDEDCQLASEWATLTHLRASDNDDVVVPPMPACVAAWQGA